MRSPIERNHLSPAVQTGLAGGTMRIAKIVGLAAVLTLTAFAGPITITHSSVGTGTVGATSSQMLPSLSSNWATRRTAWGPARVNCSFMTIRLRSRLLVSGHLVLQRRLDLSQRMPT